MGYRSLAAPWIGGAAAPVTVAQAGYRGLLAFWAGGASSLDAVAEPEAGGGRSRGGYEPSYRRREERKPEGAQGGQVSALLRALSVGVPVEQFEGFVESLEGAGLVSQEEALAWRPDTRQELASEALPIRIDNRLRIILAYWALN